MPHTLNSFVCGQGFGVCEAPAGARQFSTATESSLDVGYEAARDSGRRKNIAPNNRSEDHILRPASRAKLIANARDAFRNMPVIGWILRRHLDYCCEFNFHATTVDTKFNEQLQEFVERWSEPANFDAKARDSLPQFVRFVESGRILAGDVGVLKLRTGLVQTVEGDRVRDQYGLSWNDQSRLPGRWVHGVQIDDAGRHLAFQLWNRSAISGYEFDRVVPRKNMQLVGYYGREEDQVRGIPLIAPALNAARDAHEASGHALQRMKADAIFATVLTRNALQSEDDAADYADIDLTVGPSFLEINPGETIANLQSNSPSNQFQDFILATHHMTLLALDLPLSFLRPDLSNFFGNKSAWQHYEKSCRAKRRTLRELLDELTLWRIQLAILDGELTPPPGFTLDKRAWAWVASATPWWDPSKDADGDHKSISIGSGNLKENSLARTGKTFAHHIDNTLEALNYRRAEREALGFYIRLDPTPNPVPPPGTPGNPVSGQPVAVADDPSDDAPAE